jgi:glycerol-3-phosphate dehydrogenase
MWPKGWRDETWSQLHQDWDLVIIGGGITGAGILRQATAVGLKALLVEARDFSFGTSSRSSKLVHGGFRYLREGQFKVTKESVREREWMLREAPHLVTKMGFLLADYQSFKVPLAEFHLGVVIYDLLAPKWDHQKYNATQMLQTIPGLRSAGLLGGFLYFDATMDDSRIVLRILREAVRQGGTALNYARVERILLHKAGTACGVALQDTSHNPQRTMEIQAKAIINATGPFSDELRNQLGGAPHIRKLRGSHLVFSQERWPLPIAATLIHPRDHRALFVIPWEGLSMIGTTDLDHPRGLEEEYREPFATPKEIDYLLEALNFLFPKVKAGQEDILSTFSGVRPTIRSDDSNKPSQVSREHVLYEENGMITITGGKFTTFRLMSKQALIAALKTLGKEPKLDHPVIFDPLPEMGCEDLDPSILRYQLGRHGTDTAAMLAAAQPGELEPFGPLNNTPAELRWAARDEGVEHLDDLLLRRVRLGNLLPDGAIPLLPRIRKITQPELGWSDARWQAEEKSYRKIWKTYYSNWPGQEL